MAIPANNSIIKKADGSYEYRSGEQISLRRKVAQTKRDTALLRSIAKKYRFSEDASIKIVCEFIEGKLLYQVQELKRVLDRDSGPLGGKHGKNE